MYRFLIYAITFIFVLTGCLSCQQGDNASTQILKQANALLQTHPKQAHLLLDSIKYPENLEAVLISFDKSVKHDLDECNLYHSFCGFSKEFVIDGQPSEVFQP